MPINVILLLLFIALIFHKKSAKTSIKALFLAMSLLLISTLAPISDRLIAPIEYSYLPYIKTAKQIDYIIVLGCNHTSAAELPITSQLDTCSLQRTVEALRIYQLHPEARVITSGYSGSDTRSNALAVKEALVLFGVPAQRIMTENFPKDTREEASLIAPRILGTQVILITNASHMPRAIIDFQAEGAYPIAAPTGYWVKDLQGDKPWGYYLPDEKKLAQTTTAWYETLGLIAQWFRFIFG